MNHFDKINEFKKTADSLTKMFNNIKISEPENKIQLKFKNLNKTYSKAYTTNFFCPIGHNNVMYTPEGYEMKCINCKSNNIFMHIYYELQKCDDCKFVYIPKELEMK
jgi:hypothetical protein